jgi:hypothetical protein
MATHSMVHGNEQYAVLKHTTKKGLKSLSVPHCNQHKRSLRLAYLQHDQHHMLMPVLDITPDVHAKAGSLPLSAPVAAAVAAVAAAAAVSVSSMSLLISELAFSNVHTAI